MKKLSILLVILIAVSCTEQHDYTPREINWDRDICVLCLMGLAEQEYSAQAINQWGEVIWFDDLGCYINFKGSEDWKRFKDGGQVQAWIGHCRTGEWIDLEKAQYIYGDRTPMGYGYGAISIPNDSSYDYQTTVQRIKDGKSMRNQFMKEHNMNKTQQ
jgi:copper chaperone NosL